ncbi:hypothetical protein Rhopal_004445-T1 [Rhodotorula paludigena]|uniref:Uncharacterized protein n=1 Tax=Rhodotorula paludigena TaxID=86838 RepID=A0AAV5GNB7_9BASI|nr:hypothetical protein Rhopal_004445-T1 [Rhodotorula paludigena]
MDWISLRVPLPPGLPLPFDSAATRALSVPSIALSVALELRRLCLLQDESESADQLDDARMSYPALRTCSLVSPALRDAAQRVLFKHVCFRSGRSVHQWLDTVGEGSPKHPTRDLTFYDELPFKPAEVDGDGAKWSYEDAGSVLRKVLGVKKLQIHWAGQPCLPGDWFVGDNLKDVEILELNSPISTPSKPLPFRLEQLGVHDIYGRYLSRDFGPTFDALNRMRDPHRLKYLVLSAFPRAERYLTRILRLAPSLIALKLGIVRASPHLWQLYVFATACTSLRQLTVTCFLDMGAEALVAFPTGPPVLQIDRLLLPVGWMHDDVDPTLLPRVQAHEVLFKTLMQKNKEGEQGMKGVQSIHVNALARNDKARSRLVRAVFDLNIPFCLNFDKDEPPKEEKAELARLIAKSKDRKLFQLERLEKRATAAVDAKDWDKVSRSLQEMLDARERFSAE